MVGGTIIGVVAGFGAYALSTAIADKNGFNLQDALVATTARAATGLAIGSGTALLGAWDDKQRNCTPGCRCWY